MSWIAEYDTQGREFPTCVHLTKTRGTMTHGATYVPIEDGKAVRAENAKLRHDLEEANNQAEEVCIENAKLRELVRDMFYAVHPIDREKFLTNVAELGIEVYDA